MALWSLSPPVSGSAPPWLQCRHQCHTSRRDISPTGQKSGAGRRPVKGGGRAAWTALQCPAQRRQWLQQGAQGPRGAPRGLRPWPALSPGAPGQLRFVAALGLAELSADSSLTAGAAWQRPGAPGPCALLRPVPLPSLPVPVPPPPLPAPSPGAPCHPRAPPLQHRCPQWASPPASQF